MQASVFVVAIALSSILPQKAVPQNMGEDQKESRYSEASLKFDILEAQLQTLRKKMQLRSKAKAEQTKEWNEHYEKVKQQIEAWDDFVDSYGVK